MLENKSQTKAIERSEFLLKRPSLLSPTSTISSVYPSPLKQKSSRFLRKKKTLKDVQEVSYDSKSNSEVYDIQSLYQNYMNNPLNALDKSPRPFDRSPLTFDKSPILYDKSQKTFTFATAVGEYEPKKKYINKIKSVKKVYYNALKKRMGRRKSKIVADPDEFTQLIKTIQDDMRTPNDIRMNDIVIIDKTPLERLINYKDKLPLLETRKQIAKIAR